MNEIPDFMLGYFSEREQQRADDVEDLLAPLTPRERSLMRDVAVMAYVLGRRHPDGTDHPKDSDVFFQVLSALSRAEPDNYPAVLSGVTYTRVI